MSTGRAHRKPGQWLPLILLIVLAVGFDVAAAAPPSTEPGAIRLNSGLILRGLCSTTNTFLDVQGLEDLNIELRQIDQGYRRILVSTRHSQSVVPNPSDWPVQSFAIPQKRTSNDPLPQAIGPLAFGAFDSDGTAEVSMATVAGTITRVRVGIIQINELYADVIGLTHNWRFSVATSALPARIMFPGMVSRVPKFDSDAFVRLEIARMLIRAQRLEDAAAVLNSIQVDFPNEAGQLPAIESELHSEHGRQLLAMIRQRRDAGQYRLALNAGLVFPQTEIAADVQLDARNLVSVTEQTEKRCAAVRFQLNTLVARLESADTRTRATAVLPQISAAIHADTIDRFSAFELLADAEGVKPEASLAMAISGWLMGADNAIQNLEESLGLFDAYVLLSDFLQTAEGETRLRAELMTRIAEQEGVSPDRVAAMLRHLPALRPPRLTMDMTAASRRITFAATTACPGYTLQLPPEFHPYRQYPVLIAMPREGISTENTVAFWSGHADQHGYVVASPELYEDNVGQYDASAIQHAMFLAFVRELKLSLSIDDERVFVAGHGIGGEAAADLATSHPDLFAGVISIAGLGRRHLQWTAHNNMGMPWYLVVGEAQGDWFERMRVLLASRLFRRNSSTRSIADVLLVLYPNRGFEAYFEELSDVFAWMQLYRRSNDPRQIDAAILRSTDLSWSWLKLEELPAQFAQLDAPGTWNDGDFHPGSLVAEITSNNAILVKRTPTPSLTIHLSPDMPGIDLQKSITIRSGRVRKSVDYDPRVADILEGVYQSGERKRLCYMRIRVTD